MIEDLFFKRYRELLFLGSQLHSSVSRVIAQAAHIFADDVSLKLDLDEGFFQLAEHQLIREFGFNIFPAKPSSFERCVLFLLEGYDLWDNRHGSPDLFAKLRFSLIELLFRNAERVAAERAATVAKLGVTGLRRIGFGSRTDQASVPPEQELRAVVSSAIKEMNARFREAGVGLHYHNGLLQLAQDDLTQTRIAEPFWSIVSDSKWANVDQDMKEAVDRANTGGQDPALYAAMALESTIKIISGEKGWTRGTEAGAHAYIHNLVSQRNGRFIEPWEAEALKLIFTHVRNPHGHGPGSAPQPNLTPEQTMWTIETCMSWIKSLVRRM